VGLAMMQARVVAMVPAEGSSGTLAARRSHRRGELGANRAERVTDAVTDPRT